MLTIVMLLIGPIGIIFLILERRHARENRMLMAQFVGEVKENPALTDRERIDHIENAYRVNGFETVYKDQQRLETAKKEFSLGTAFIGISLVWVGLVAYLVYYFFLQRPKKVTIDLHQVKE